MRSTEHQLSTNQDKLAYLLYSLPLPPPPVWDKTPTEQIDLEVRLAREFGRDFRRNAHLRFLKFVQHVNDRFCTSNGLLSYFKGTPIVQSSGTGKSRMVLELRH
ncbi:hypothetical protein NDA16_000808 [Ustilago loliicola]|nr:hypothetical protein NDA16_000808 [Ustilago loliicola]